MISAAKQTRLKSVSGLKTALCFAVSPRKRRSDLAGFSPAQHRVLNAAAVCCEDMSSLRRFAYPYDRDNRGRHHVRALLRTVGSHLSARLAYPGALHTPSRIRRLAQTHRLAWCALAGPRRLPDRRRHLGFVRAAHVPEGSRGRDTWPADARRLANLSGERTPLGSRADRVAVAALVESVRPELSVA